MFGFSENQTFASLMEDNRYLYRVHDAKSKTPLVPGTGFVARNFQDLSPANLETKRESILKDPSEAEAFTHARMTGSTSYIGTTFSLSWAIWEANQRADYRGTEQVKISVIDGHLLRPYASTAVTLLSRCSSEADFEMLKNHANLAQEVLVYAFIPEKSILATIHWDHVLPALPSWYREGDKLREGRPDPVYPKKHFKARLRFEAFVTAFNALRLNQDEKDIHSESIRLAMAMMAERMHPLTSIDELDIIENIITDIAAEICRWPSRQYNPQREETEMWESKRIEIGNLVGLDQQLSIKRDQILLEDDVQILLNEWKKVTEILATTQSSYEFVPQ
jgi:hypothetical protein